MSTLPIRLVSAAVAVAILFLTRAYLQEVGLFIVTGIIVLLALKEFSSFFSTDIRKDTFFRILFFSVGAVVFLSSYYSQTILLASFWSASTILIIYLLLKIRKEEDREVVFRNQCLAVVGLLYCSVSPALTAQVLFLFENGSGWFLTVLAIVFFGDGFAMFAGYFFGKRKLTPLISPKKTWAGAVGGIFGSVLFGCLFSYWFLDGVSLVEIGWIAAVTGCCGQFGDLFESLAKRVAGVKDTGNIMPGHGGILDRIDGVLFSGPVFYYLVKLMHFSS